MADILNWGNFDTDVSTKLVAGALRSITPIHDCFVKVKEKVEEVRESLPILDEPEVAEGDDAPSLLWTSVQDSATRILATLDDLDVCQSDMQDGVNTVTSGGITSSHAKSNIQVRQNGKIVVVNGHLNKGTPFTALEVIGTVTDVAMPSSVIYFVGATGATSSDLNTCWMNTDGTLVVQSSPVGTVCAFNFSYIVD